MQQIAIKHADGFTEELISFTALVVDGKCRVSARAFGPSALSQDEHISFEHPIDMDWLSEFMNTIDSLEDSYEALCTDLDSQDICYTDSSGIMKTKRFYGLGDFLYEDCPALIQHKEKLDRFSDLCVSIREQVEARMS